MPTSARKYWLMRPALSSVKPKSIMRRIAIGTARVAPEAATTAISAPAMRALVAQHVRQQRQERAGRGLLSRLLGCVGKGGIGKGLIGRGGGFCHLYQGIHGPAGGFRLAL